MLTAPIFVRPLVWAVRWTSLGAQPFSLNLAHLLHAVCHMRLIGSAAEAVTIIETSGFLGLGRERSEHFRQ